MTDRTCLLAASFQRSAEDAYSTTFIPGCETAAPGNQGRPGRSGGQAVDNIPGRRPGELVLTRHSATDIMVRAALPEADQHRILALPYPVGYRVFWQILADLGVTQESLMDRMGASP
jgi:hypothetical protein